MLYKSIWLLKEGRVLFFFIDQREIMDITNWRSYYGMFSGSRH